MRMFRWVGRIALVLIVVVAAVGLWRKDDIIRLLAVNSLFDADRIVENFSHMDALFFHAPLSRGAGPVSALPAGPAFTLPPSVERWVSDRTVTGLVILHKGQLVHESYYHGTHADDLRISWSVAKSFLASLMGVIVEEGAIASLDEPVIKYAPALKGSAYETATIHDVLTMSSGVAFNEDYLDFNSDINKMGRVLALGSSMDGFAAGLVAQDAPPGQVWHYVSIDTHVIGMVIRGATGRGIAELMNEKIIGPLGLEVDPYYLTDGLGEPFVLGGLNLRTRDYARMGQMILQGGNWQGQQVVPADWVAAMTRPQAADGADYGYQWWIPANARAGEAMAQGIYGQYIYISPEHDAVIAVNAADRDFTAEGVSEGNLAMFRQLARDVASAQ